MTKTALQTHPDVSPNSLTKPRWHDALRRSGGSAWSGRWQLLFMASDKRFGYRDGDEWGGSHYLLAKSPAVAGDGSMT